MKIVDIIEKKKKGEVLTENEIKFFIDVIMSRLSSKCIINGYLF
jgi:thymidine phosphorylase